MFYVEHVEARGREFFEKICELDLEGVVAKRVGISNG
jgi:ATP-dependent DNA ligase